MATKGKDEKQIINPEQSAQGSIFKTALIAGPIAIGGGLGISRLSKRSNHFGKSVSELPFNPAADAIRRFTNRYSSPTHTSTFKDWQLDKLAGFSSNVAIPHEHIRSSWMRAAKAVDPTGTISALSNKRLGSATTPHQILGDIREILRSTDSIYMQRASSMFLQDLAIMQERAEQGLRLSTGGIRTSIASKLETVPLGQLDVKIRQDLSRMAQLLGAKQIDIKRLSRTGFEGSELRISIPTTRIPTKTGEFTLAIPESLKSNKGVFVQGTVQQNKYISGTYGIVEQGVLRESFNHEQWHTRRAVEELIPRLMNENRLDQRRTRQIIGDFEKSIIEAPEWVPTIDNPAVNRYVSARSQIMRLYSPFEAGVTPKPISEFQYADIMRQGGLKLPTGEIQSVFPGFSASHIAGGVVSIKDVRGAFGLVPEAVPYARRPLQPLRIGYSPTAEAIQRMQTNPIDRAFAWAAAGEAIESPMLKTAYVSSKYNPTMAELGFHSEGQLLMSKAAADNRAVKQWKQFNIAADQLVDLENLIDKENVTGVWNINKKLREGSLLGYSPEGYPVMLPNEMNITTATLFPNTKSKGSYIRVMAEEEIGNMPYSKVFGAAKGMAKEVEQSYLDQIMRKHITPADTGMGLFSNVEAIVTMDELKKNRGLHYNQMFTALWEYTRANMQGGKQVSTIASNFANDPNKIIAQLRQNAFKGNQFIHEEMLKGITGIARGAQLAPSQMGMVFGAVPEVFGTGYQNIMGKLSSAEQVAINRGVAGGVGQFFFEGLGGPGAGNMATIEPRMFELLNAPHFGKLGGQLQAEIAERMMHAYPERMAEQAALTKSLQSITNLKKIAGSKQASSVLGDIASGGYLNLGDIGDVYIPEAEKLKQLAGYKTATGRIITPDLTKLYKDLAESAQEYELGQLDKGTIINKLNILKSEVARARSLTVTGQGGVLRGRLPGSMFLTAVTGTEVEPGVVGITRPYMKKMVDEMAKLNMYSATEIAGMHSRLEAGETVSGLIGRHPYLGPYSTQISKLKLIPGKDPIIMFNEKWMKASIETSKGQIQQLANPIKLSPLTGLAGDTDGDIIAASLVSPKMEQSLSNYTSSQNLLDLYDQYAIRSQLMKAKAPADSITLRQAMAGDSIKLAITEGGRLGKISMGLQRGRAAVLSGIGGLSNEERMNALGLLEWMEQTPISGKHIAPGEEMQMIGLMEDIHEAMSKKDANAIANNARNVLAKSKTEAQEALGKGFKIRLEDISGNITKTMRIPGIDINKAAQNITDVMSAYEATGVEGVSATRARDLLMGRSLPKSYEASAMLNKKMLNLSPYGALFTHTLGETGRFASMAENMLSTINRIGAAGKSLIPFAKPIALGGLASVALANVLSEPAPSLRSEQIKPPIADMKSGTGGSFLGTQIHPDHGIDAEPIAKNPVTIPNTARISSNRPLHYGNKIRIRSNSQGGINYNQLSEQLKNGLGQKSRISSFVQDRRISINSKSLNDIMENS